MLLWTIFAGLTAFALIVVLWPLLRGRAQQDSGGLTYDAAIFKDQIDEIDAELETGLLSEAEAESARNEVSRRLLEAARDDQPPEKGSDGTRSGLAAFALAAAFLLLPVTSSGLYLFYGSPGLPDQPLAARLSKPAEGHNIQTLVAQVEARLREQPQDGRGWEVIAPVYLRLKRFDDAADAYAKALRILGETPERLSDYGNARVLASDGVVDDTARRVLSRAVALNPQMMRARFWLAVAYEQDGMNERAVEAWRDLLARSEKDAPWREAVEQRLAELTGGDEDKKDEGKKQVAGNEALRGPSSEDVTAAREMSAGDRAQMIGQMVAGLADRLRSEGGNIDEWKRLIRSYKVLGKPTEADKALADAKAAFAKDQAALADLDGFANALGMTIEP